MDLKECSCGLVMERGGKGHVDGRSKSRSSRRRRKKRRMRRRRNKRRRRRRRRSRSISSSSSYNDDVMFVKRCLIPRPIGCSGGDADNHDHDGNDGNMMAGPWYIGEFH